MERPADESFNKFNYLLRPSKQVERKLFIEALHKLAGTGFSISDYTYLGFGSPYYADFLLFHKYLYINKMICVEKADIPKRMKFNRPFNFIKLKLMTVGEVLPTLNRTQKYLVWLDYDCLLNEEVLRDLSSCIHLLAPGSILIITVEAEPTLPEEEDDEELSDSQRVDRLLKILTNQLGRYYPGTIEKNIIARNTMPVFFAKILRSKIAEESAKREGLRFFQLFNYKYADGAQMVTVGGILVDEEMERKVQDSGVCNLELTEQGGEPKKISVPPLTVREKQWLDQNLRKSLTVSSLAFELQSESLETYKKYYRHYPTYYETLL